MVNNKTVYLPSNFCSVLFCDLFLTNNNQGDQCYMYMYMYMVHIFSFNYYLDGVFLVLTVRFAISWFCFLGSLLVTNP